MRFANTSSSPCAGPHPRSPTHGKAGPGAKLKRKLLGSGPIPRGWQDIVRELDRGLTMLAITNPARISETMVIGQFGADGRDALQLHAADRVVHGVVRKADARARATCRICGKRVHRPQGMSSSGGYCPQHLAAAWLLWLASQNAEPTKSEGRGLFVKAASDGSLRVPRELVELWLARDTTAAAMAARRALSDDEVPITLDSFDAAAFLAWLKPLAPALKRLVPEPSRREQPRR